MLHDRCELMTYFDVKSLSSLTEVTVCSFTFCCLTDKPAVSCCNYYLPLKADSVKYTGMRIELMCSILICRAHRMRIYRPGTS